MRPRRAGVDAGDGKQRSESGGPRRRGAKGKKTNERKGRKKMKEVWSGGVGDSLAMVQDEMGVPGLTEVTAGSSSSFKLEAS